MKTTSQPKPTDSEPALPEPLRLSQDHPYFLAIYQTVLGSLCSRLDVHTVRECRQSRQETSVDLIDEDNERINELVQTAYTITRRAIEELECGAAEEESEIARFNAKV